jgi:hypothetical protein
MKIRNYKSHYYLLVSSYCLSLRCGYSDQNFVIRHQQSAYEMFFRGETQNFTSIVFNTIQIIVMDRRISMFIDMS